METRGKEIKEAWNYKRLLFCGFAGAGVLLFLLLCAAYLSETFLMIHRYPNLTGKLCLMIAALFSGLLGARKAERKKMLYAAAGEWGLLLVILICSMVFGNRNGWVSILLDFIILLFGAFASALAAGKRRNQRRGKGVYRT